MCVACGGPIAACLVRVASLRCHDCRDAHAELRAELVERRLYLVSPPELQRSSFQRAA
jgi:hypothetical protein